MWRGGVFWGSTAAEETTAGTPSLVLEEGGEEGGSVWEGGGPQGRAGGSLEKLRKVSIAEAQPLLHVWLLGAAAGCPQSKSWSWLGCFSSCGVRGLQRRHLGGLNSSQETALSCIPRSLCLMLGHFVPQEPQLEQRGYGPGFGSESRDRREGVRSEEEKGLLGRGSVWPKAGGWLNREDALGSLSAVPLPLLHLSRFPRCKSRLLEKREYSGDTGLQPPRII